MNITVTHVDTITAHTHTTFIKTGAREVSIKCQSITACLLVELRRGVTKASKLCLVDGPDQLGVSWSEDGWLKGEVIIKVTAV